MTMLRAGTVLGLAAVACAAVLAAAAPASAGGIGAFLAPAFGNSCALQHAPHAEGAITHGTGTGDGSLTAFPFGGSVNQCGGTDIADADFLGRITQSGTVDWS
ncbi:hypothetical protein [Streptomyces rimosus]|uniref:hypothetical protein n=1 Tax=Streptomyces rimosus TaxID=1927 RepID=UPI0004CACCF5|nr:hypothetical protein [Streptomyces rimosus]